MRDIKNLFLHVLVESTFVVRMARGQISGDVREIASALLHEYYKNDPSKATQHLNHIALDMSVFDEIKMLLKQELLVLKLSLMGLLGLFFSTLLLYMISGISYVTILPMFGSLFLIAFISGYLMSEYRYVNTLNGQRWLCRYTKKAIQDFLKFLESYRDHQQFGLSDKDWQLLRHEASLMLNRSVIE